MAVRLGEIMEELERHDYYAGDGQDRVPSWIRAHFILEAELEQQRAGEDPASLHPTVPLLIHPAMSSYKCPHAACCSGEGPAFLHPTSRLA